MPPEVLVEDPLCQKPLVYALQCGGGTLVKFGILSLQQAKPNTLIWQLIEYINNTAHGYTFNFQDVRENKSPLKNAFE